ncbi:MAG: helix-turn-helix domain-containing protein [Marinifilaceae bacterium]
MSILYIEEHKSCLNYVTMETASWITYCAETDEEFESLDNQYHYLLFILEGNVKITFLDIPHREYNQGEMVLIPKMSSIKGIATSTSRLLIHRFGKVDHFCDRVPLEALTELKKKYTWQGDSLPIKDTISKFLLLLETYLSAGLGCKHLHELKQRELFMLLRGFYTKEQLALFLHPIIGQSMDFKEQIYSTYLSIKSVSDWANMCGFSEREFHDKFVENFHDTPSHWRSYRIAQHIRFLLNDANMPINEIAYKYNFSSQAHLTKFCKQHLGDTPKAIRASLINGLKIDN